MPARKPANTPTTELRRRGRPTKLNNIVRYKDDANGNPDPTQPVTVAESILQDLRTGATLRWAIGRAGILMPTIQDWKRQGTRINSDLINNKRTTSTLTAEERRLLDFSYQLDQAEAEGKLRHFGSVASAGLRPQVTRKTVTVTETDPEGKTTVRTAVEEVEKPPDWRAALAVLERTDPEFITRTVTELSGEGGGPVQLEVAAATVMDKLRRIRETNAIEVTAVEPGELPAGE